MQAARHGVVGSGAGLRAPGPRLGVLLALLTCLTGAVAAELPRDFRAVYAVRSNGLEVGRMERRFSRAADGRYAFESETRATGLVALFKRGRVVEVSHGRIVGDGLAPEEYRYELAGGERSNKDVRVWFDWPAGTIVNEAKGQRWQFAAEAAALDRLVYQLLIMRDLAAGPRTLAYRIADGGRVKDYQFDVTGNETIGTDAGRFETVRLARLHEDPRRATTVWCARELGFLPVRVDHREKNGNLTSALLEETDLRP